MHTDCKNINSDFIIYSCKIHFILENACGFGITFPVNSTNSIFSTFLVTGITGLEAEHIWISIPFFTMFFITLLGNATIIAVIWWEQSLHIPMYLFLAMLAASDLGLSLFTFPTMLRTFWFDARELTHSLCFTQMFFIHTFQDFESAVILAMAFDRYVAISRPLHYTSILTNGIIVRIGLAIIVRTLTVQVPLPILLGKLCFCHSNVLSHSYCLHPDIIKLSCSNTRINSIFGLFVLLSTMGLDFILILFSYVLILKTVLSIASHAGRLKALNTCISHLCAVVLFFTPMICLSMLHRFGPRLPSHFYVVMANMHFFIPPVMNPIVYVVKTKHIRDKILKLFVRREYGKFHITSVT
ncbi:olfactory receptor 51G2-like [Dasypus novemcinctus]|uniref:olfactory receptor 51G2-like n=1 Tax=Dasypus novemcinctus TaxID=9361 RepID=UPI0026603F89|nr:olfactory receptor 51G2-like [Dasypus novemcinctus]